MASKKFIDTGTRNKPLFSNYGCAIVFHRRMPGTSFRFNHFFTYAQNEPAAFCLREDEISGLLGTQIREFGEGRYGADFFRRMASFYEIPFNQMRKRLRKDYSRASNERLAADLDFACLRAFLNHPPMLFGLLAQNLKDYFMAELRRSLHRSEPSDPGTLLRLSAILLIPPRLSLPRKEEQLFLLLEGEYFSYFKRRKFGKSAFRHFAGLTKTRTLLSRLEGECGWFHMEYMMHPWNAQDYLAQLLKRASHLDRRGADLILRPKSPSLKLKATMLEQRRFFSAHPRARKLKKLVQVMQQMAVLLDHTKELVVRGLFLMRPLMSEIGKRLGLTWLETQYLLPEEMGALLSLGKKADKKLIRQRMHERAVLMDRGMVRVCSGNEAGNLARKLMQVNAPTGLAELKGLGVYPGKVRGVVKIVRSQKDRRKFRRGDILVSHDISTELTSFLKLASAIVTDMGGMISHAATVAREFKTPAVLQTKFATRILKDGDWIEVNAFTGKVRKIEK